MLLYLSFPEVEEDSLGRLALLRGDQVGGAHQHLGGTGGTGGVGQVELDRWSGTGVDYLGCRLQLHLGHLEDTTSLLSQPPKQGLHLRYNLLLSQPPTQGLYPRYNQSLHKASPSHLASPWLHSHSESLTTVRVSLQTPLAAASLASTVSLPNPLTLTLAASSPLPLYSRSSFSISSAAEGALRI